MLSTLLDVMICAPLILGLTEGQYWRSEVTRGGKEDKRGSRLGVGWGKGRCALSHRTSQNTIIFTITTIMVSSSSPFSPPPFPRCHVR
jgi:hypothetical protein